MRNCNRKINLALLAIVAAGLLAVPPETRAQPPEDPENFVWITDTKGMTWKKKIGLYGGFSFNSNEESDKPKIASILVPEHANINYINVKGCVNLTNIVFQPASGKRWGALDHAPNNPFWRNTDDLNIYAQNTGLSNITCSKTMRERISLSRTGWWPIYWTELELSKLEIRTHTTANGTEVEIVWRDGKLQIADAVNGEYRDHLGSSPLRFPLAAAKDKQFFRIARIESPTTEEPPTPR